MISKCNNGCVCIVSDGEISTQGETNLSQRFLGWDDDGLADASGVNRSEFANVLPVYFCHRLIPRPWQSAVLSILNVCYSHWRTSIAVRRHLCDTLHHSLPVRLKNRRIGFFLILHGYSGIQHDDFRPSVHIVKAISRQRHGNSLRSPPQFQSVRAGRYRTKHDVCTPDSVPDVTVVLDR